MPWQVFSTAPERHNMLDEKLKSVAVIGAGGKMGSGIALLLLQEMARLDTIKYGSSGSGHYRMTLIDANEDALFKLKEYLKTQLRKFAEQGINRLRQWFASNKQLVSNQEMVESFVNGAMDMIEFNRSAKHAQLVFEAIVENVKIKAEIFKSLSNPHAYFFTNTSSIPIDVLSREGQLGNRIIGFHFYNPPAVQKLLELIPPKNVDPKLHALAIELAERLKKNTIVSKDVAGFIGNGHFMREILYSFKKAEELSRIYTLPQAVYMINKVTQEYLIRPMGMFQLIDYVGLDTCRSICDIMRAYLPDDRFKFPELNYRVPADKCDNILGPLPEGHRPWKLMQKEPQALDSYFQHLYESQTMGSQLAKEFLKNSMEISNGLVSDGVASSLDDVEIVLKQGFYHLYGPKYLAERKLPCAV